ARSLPCRPSLARSSRSGGGRAGSIRAICSSKLLRKLLTSCMTGRASSASSALCSHSEFIDFVMSLLPHACSIIRPLRSVHKHHPKFRGLPHASEFGRILIVTLAKTSSYGDNALTLSPISTAGPIDEPSTPLD